MSERTKTEVTYKEWLELVPVVWCEKYDLRFHLDVERFFSINGNMYIKLPKNFTWIETKERHEIKTNAFTLILYKNVKEWHLNIFDV